MFFGYYQSLAAINSDQKAAAQNFPILLLLIIVNVFILTQIPALTASIFSGHTGGHSGGVGSNQGLVLRRSYASHPDAQSRRPPGPQNGI